MIINHKEKIIYIHNPKDYRTYYCEDSIKIVEELFDNDIKTFDFKF